MALEGVTQAQRDALLAAIVAGTTRIRTSDGRLIEYASLEEMRRILAEMDEALATSSTTSDRSSRVSFSRE